MYSDGLGDAIIKAITDLPETQIGIDDLNVCIYFKENSTGVRCGKLTKETKLALSKMVYQIIGRNERHKSVNGCSTIAEVNKLADYGNVVKAGQRQLAKSMGFDEE